MSAAQKLLERLDDVRESSVEGQWMALCPAHSDKTPSLSVREVDNRVLLNCFAGCAASEIVQAVGLSLADLFDKPLDCGPIRKHDRWNERGLFKQLMPDIDVIVIASAQVMRGQPLSAVDHKRLREAHERVMAAWMMVA